jgi:DUF2934 family protein
MPDGMERTIRKERRTMTSIPDPIENPHLSETDLALSERHVKIQTRAYELYLERGDGSGSEFDDWLKAELEIDSE